jgi:hypothetical protein
VGEVPRAVRHLWKAFWLLMEMFDQVDRLVPVLDLAMAT